MNPVPVTVIPITSPPAYDEKQQRNATPEQDAPKPCKPELIDVLKSDDVYVNPPNIEVSYDDVFDDPKVFQDMANNKCLKCARKTNSAVYNFFQGCMYYMLSILLGVFLGLGWGLVFGTVNFVVVWMVQPVVKLVYIAVRPSVQIVRVIIRAFLDPVFETMGQCLKYTRAGIKVDVSGKTSHTIHTV